MLENDYTKNVASNMAPSTKSSKLHSILSIYTVVTYWKKETETVNMLWCTVVLQTVRPKHFSLLDDHP